MHTSSAIRNTPWSRNTLRKTSALAVLSLFALAGCSSSSVSSDVPAPPSTGNILDTANLLSDTEETNLNQLIDQQNSQTDAARVAIYTYDHSHGDIEKYAQNVANSWGVGDQGKKNGVLIAVDMDSHKAAISTADGVRKTLTDDAAQDIIDHQLTPELKDKDYARAFTDTTNKVYDYAANGAPEQTPDYTPMIVISLMAIVAGVISGIFIGKQRKRRKEVFELADAEIQRLKIADPSLQVTDEMRDAYRKYRLAYQKPPRGDGNEYNRVAEQEETEYGTQYTRYASNFNAWLPLYLMYPHLYAGAGTQPPSYAASSNATGSSFGGGGGFSGGGASGSF